MTKNAEKKFSLSKLVTAAEQEGTRLLAQGH